MENARNSIILAADLPDYARIESRDKDRAEELASRFHQVLGECVYAYGGTVNDTMGSIVIAELPDPTSAVHSLENLGKRVKAELASESALVPRAVLTSGEVHERNFSLAGQAVQNALAILDSLKKGQMLVGADLVKASGHLVQGDPVLTLGAVPFYAMPLARPEPVRREPAAVPSAAGHEADAELTEDTPPQEPTRKTNTPLIAGAAVVLLLVIIAAAFLMLNREKSEPVAAAAPAPAPAPEPVDDTIQISIGGVAVAPEIDLEEDAVESDVRSMLTSLLRAADNVELNALASNKVGAELRMIAPEPAEEGPVAAAAQPVPVPAETIAAEPRVVPWVEQSGERLEGPDAAYDDLWSIVTPTVEWAGSQLGFDTVALIPQSEELKTAFAEAVLRAPGDQTDALIGTLHGALAAEPDFLAGWLLLSQADTADPALEPIILDALRNISRIKPDRVDLARDLGRRELAEGTLVGAIEAYSRVRAAEPQDEEARRVIALAALASHQPALFQEAVSAGDPRLHPADVEVSEGKINEGVKKYYEAEAETPDNPYLSFKIGRIAVLRRSPQIAQIEVDKLEAAGTEPQHSLLRAYMAADERKAGDAESALESARESADWADSPWFHSAEVYAILRDADRTVEAIERSVDRREPMMHAIATNPLFRYLTGDPRFREAVRQLLVHQRAVSQRLQGVS